MSATIQMKKVQKKQQKTVEAFGRQALVVQVNVGDEKSVQNLFDKVIKQFNRIDIFVNNAGLVEKIDL